MFYDRYKELCKQHGKSPTAVAVENGISKSAVSTWKTLGRIPKMDVLNKLANYFNVSVDYLVGNEKKPTPEDGSGLTEKSDISDDDIKFALFGGGPVTDEQFAEVKQFVRFIKERDANGGKR